MIPPYVITLAVIRPLDSTYSSTGVPSGVFPKSILSTLLRLLGSWPARTSAASADARGAPSKAVTSTTHPVYFRIARSPLGQPLKIPELAGIASSHPEKPNQRTGSCAPRQDRRVDRTGRKSGQRAGLESLDNRRNELNNAYPST